MISACEKVAVPAQVKTLPAAKVFPNVVAPLIVFVPSESTKFALAPASGIVYVRDAAGAVALIVVLFVVPRTI